MAKAKTEPKSLYFIGIKGVAMAGLAVMAKEAGYEVIGSDVAETFPTDSVLAHHRISVLEGFNAENVINHKPDLVIISAAYGPNHVEAKAAKSLRLSIIPQSEMLARLMTNYEGVGVAGVHGKTTTTTLLAYILRESGFSPSYAIGAGEIPSLGSNAHLGEGKYFVVEADEYRKSEQVNEPKFLDLPLKHVIITSVEYEHPDVYDSADAVYQVFYRLASKIPRNGSTVACVDWPLVRRLVIRCADRPIISYGFSSLAHYQIVRFTQSAKQSTFYLKSPSQLLGPFTMTLPGRYNAQNAAGAIIMALQLGVSEAAISKALYTFQAPPRRFQYLGTLNGAPVYDDYAHHPTAVSELLAGVKEKFPEKRIVLVFQPHTYSRTGKFLREFAESLRGADKLILLNIYASSREKSGYVTIRDLIEQIRPLKPDVEYRSSLDEAATYLQSFISGQDILLLVGAGDVYKIYSKTQST